MNQSFEQIARDQIDQQLKDCGWVVQKKTQINLHAGAGVAVTEYIPEAGIASLPMRRWFTNQERISQKES